MNRNHINCHVLLIKPSSLQWVIGPFWLLIMSLMRSSSKDRLIMCPSLINYPLSNTVRICSLPSSCSHTRADPRWLWHSSHWCWSCSWLALKLLQRDSSLTKQHHKYNSSISKLLLWALLLFLNSKQFMCKHYHMRDWYWLNKKLFSMICIH